MEKNIPFTIWFTGLSGSGKTTLAKKLHAELSKRKIPSVVIDGDEVRKTISRDLGFTKKDIAENHRRILTLIQKHIKRGESAIVSTISPQKRVRDAARKKLKRFMEVYCACPLHICMQRDPKGHYKNIKKGSMKQFIGVHTSYEKPEHADLVLKTHLETPGESLKKILSLSERKGFIDHR